MTKLDNESDSCSSSDYDSEDESKDDVFENTQAITNGPKPRVTIIE